MDFAVPGASSRAVMALAPGGPPGHMAPGAVRLEQILREFAPGSADRTVRALASTARIRPFVIGEIVVPQGERQSLGLIIEGLASARRTTSDGRAIVARIIGSGEFLGVMAIAAQETLFDFVAIAPGLVAVWSGAEVRSLAAADSGLALALLDLALDRAGHLAERLDSQHYQDARRRVGRVLYQHRDLCFGERPPVTRTSLSLLVGTSKEMTRRVIGRLETEGIVQRFGRTGLALTDAARLQELAGFGPNEALG
jgi:CRP-like cAMP-binding protein